MSDLPIRSLSVSNFRRIQGTQVIPFDAPIVLIHGPNGTGKTSILSALELALTRSIRSMERQSARYEAHLPYFGTPYATVRAEVTEYLRGPTPGAPVTAGDSGIEGEPALNTHAAKFYAERCYLDQASLGRLLELYEARHSNGQSALEQFVNELLGLEKLDALRDGLSDANDIRNLKKLALGADEADREAKASAAELTELRSALAAARDELREARSELRDVLDVLQPADASELADTDLLALVRSTLEDDTTRSKLAAASQVHEQIVALGGRLTALEQRPTTQRIEDLRAALAAAVSDRESWEEGPGTRVQAWEDAASALGVDTRAAQPRAALEQAEASVGRATEDDATGRTQAEAANARVQAEQATVAELQERLTSAHQHSSALLEALSVLRSEIGDDNRCPVCNRDFTETGPTTLADHLDHKLGDLTEHGQLLVELRTAHDEATTRLARAELAHSQIRARLLPEDQRQALAERQNGLADLSTQVADVETTLSAGAALTRRVLELQQALSDQESLSAEAAFVGAELTRYASELSGTPPQGTDSYRAVWYELLRQAKAELDRVSEYMRYHLEADAKARRLSSALDSESAISRRFTEAAEQKLVWDERFAETKRRQGIANEVRKGAMDARTTIVNRVFTESLNEVWRSVFTRLAPSEGFIPRFGVPSATKKTFDIKLETTDQNGEASGPPQMMLSAGNLNTAALSLFLALHLAVEPIVPCLVFDDPVQAMDEVHVAQFAGLIRVLAKQHARQVVIAVHERELFDYLSLELSPAYKGDELITIELGREATGESNVRFKRHAWSPDQAIAG